MVCPDEVGTVATLDGLLGQRHRQASLAHAGRSQHQDVDGLSDGGQSRQFFDLALVYGGLEVEVELFQGALEREVRQLGPGGEVAFPAGGDLGAQELGQHLGVGQSLVGRGVQSVVQDLQGLLETQGFHVLTGLLHGDHAAPPTTRS